MATVYAVTDRENKDRRDPVVDSFLTREDAEKFVREYQYGTVKIEEFTEEEFREMFAKAFLGTMIK